MIDLGERLTVQQVSQLLEMPERTVRAKAQQLGGVRRGLNARGWVFDRATLLERARELGLNLPAGENHETGAH